MTLVKFGWKKIIFSLCALDLKIPAPTALAPPRAGEVRSPARPSGGWDRRGRSFKWWNSIKFVIILKNKQYKTKKSFIRTYYETYGTYVFVFENVLLWCSSLWSGIFFKQINKMIKHVCQAIYLCHAHASASIDMYSYHVTTEISISTDRHER